MHPYGERTRPAEGEWWLTDDACFVTPRVFADLLQYDSTLPTGLYEGKVWKRRVRDASGAPGREWWIAEVVVGIRPEGEPTPKRGRLKWRRLYVGLMIDTPARPLHPPGGAFIGRQMLLPCGVAEPFAGYSGGCGEVPVDQQPGGLDGHHR